jgi:putative oxidoreductase
MNSTMADHSKAAHWPVLTAVAGRIGLSALFIEAGIGKLMAPSASIGYIEDAGLPFPILALATAILVEIVGALALLSGYRVRWTAATLALFCVATAAVFHANWSDHDQLIHFLKNMAVAGGLLHVCILGGGRLSLDARRRVAS